MILAPVVRIGAQARDITVREFLRNCHLSQYVSTKHIRWNLNLRAKRVSHFERVRSKYYFAHRKDLRDLFVKPLRALHRKRIGTQIDKGLALLIL